MPEEKPITSRNKNKLNNSVVIVNLPTKKFDTI